jgi:hypothetical protein
VHYDRYRRALVAWWFRAVLIVLVVAITLALIARASSVHVSQFDQVLAVALPFVAIVVLAALLAQTEAD